ncbi:MAG TPA: peptidyl-tRNA hydrolase Pth2 [Terriglobales bacterium]|nr:peptidyl-tRNA hydrolase Pth2 [Terriglobales bacterium]
MSSTDWILLEVLKSSPSLFAYLVHAQDKVGASTSPEFRYKLAIAVRRDLEMGKGKIAVQVSHASVTVAEETRKHKPDWWRAWLAEGQRKVVVKVQTESDLEKIRREADELGLAAAVIHDSGLTQVEPGTATCVGIGPAPAELVDKITGTLPLL